MTKFEVGKFYRHKESKIVYYILEKSNVDEYIRAIHIVDKSNRVIHESTRCYYEEVIASFEVKKLAPVRLSQLSKDSKFKFSGNCPETYVIKAINFICYGEIGQYICAYINEKKPDEILQSEASIPVIPVE